MCQSCSDGIPTIRKAKAVATISASGVLWLTHPCLLETPVIGQLVLGPMHTKCKPLVDLCDSVQPAKSASAYRGGWHLSSLSPTHPTRRKPLECSMYPIRRVSLRSQSDVHLVTFCARWQTALKRSNLASRAAQSTFINIRLAIDASLPVDSAG